MNNITARRTKIIATLGPATDKPEVLTALLQARVDVFRVNFSHGQYEDHERRIHQVRQTAQKCNQEVAILADLQGPKIRIAKFKQGKVILHPGQDFCLDAELARDAGSESSVGIDYKELPQDVLPGDTLLLNDGRIILSVQQVVAAQIHCRVVVGGELSNNKGINRQGGGLSAKALTEKDIQDLHHALELGADYIGLSFPRNAKDVLEAKALISKAQGTAGIIAKIERVEAIAAIDEIIEASDAVMVARGDLGVEIGDAELPGVQKHIISRARALNKAVITATQMMESMIHSTMPTRAEVFDVANAIFDGTDAVMLSAETATGDFPVDVVMAMARICLGAEKQPRATLSRHRMESTFSHPDEAIAMAAMYVANHLKIKAIIALTESGLTPRWMSRIRSGIPIYALTRHLSTQRKMMLLRGVHPLSFDVTQIPREELNQRAVAEIENRGLVQKGDRVILTKGDYLGVHGGTNAMKIVEVGSVL